jgi:hypothetical protein
MPLRGECRPACKSVAVPPTQPRPWNVALCWKCDIDLGATGPSQPLRKFIDSHIVGGVAEYKEAPFPTRDSLSQLVATCRPAGPGTETRAGRPPNVSRSWLL